MLVRTRRTGNRVGLTGLAKGQPGVALLGFLAAHQRSPSDPLPLLDAAVMLSSLGHQPEALALLDAAARLRPPGGSTVGINPRALIDNARGVVLFRLGRFASADAAFSGAVARAPGLAAAERNHAAALLCRGRTASAVAPYIKGAYVDPVRSGPASGGQAAPVPSTALDLSRGVPGTLPKLTIPATADDGAASYPDINVADQRAINDADAAYTQAQQALNLLSAQQTRLERTGTGRLMLKRQDAILGVWNNWQTDRSDLAALYAKVQADHSQMETISPSAAEQQQVTQIEQSCARLPTHAQQQQCDRTQCWPAVQAAHTNWLPQMQSYDTDVRALAAALYRYATAIAGNTTSSALATTITQGARQLMLVAYHGELANALDTMSVYENLTASQCNAPGTGTAAGDDGVVSTPTPDLCPPGLAAVKISLKFASVFNLTASCDSVQLTASDGGPITPYGTVKYTFATGSISAFVGAKAGFELDENVKLTVKGGMYMNWDGQGNLTDVGLRATGALGGPWDVVGLNAPDAKAEVSLAPILLQ